MSETKRRVMITGASRFLGLRLAKRLEAEGDIDVIGIDLDEPPVPVPGMEFVRCDIRNPLIARVIEATKVDTIVHTNIVSKSARLGGRAATKENNVIGTMQLLAAAQRAQRVKKVVVKSSSAVYGPQPDEPSIIPEGYAARRAELHGYGKDCAEAETYARDFGRRRPDVDLVILRTQNVVGPTVTTSLTDYFSLPVVPTVLGFDPRLQLLHEEDAVEAFWIALNGAGRGIFNIAGEGVVYLSQAIRLLGRIQVPLLPPSANLAAGVLKRLGAVDFPADQLNVIVYGRVVDVRRAREVLGFAPHYATRAALEDFRDRRQPGPVPDARAHPAWERELFEYLREKTDREWEKV